MRISDWSSDVCSSDLAEVQKYATVDKDKFLGDPAFVDIPLGRFLDREVVQARYESIRAGEKVHVPRINAGQPSKDTTHISVVDKDGNAVSMTHSLGMPSGVITDEIGRAHV